jgi:hypothetical protein
MDKATTFLDRAFLWTQIVRCPCSMCQNLRCLEDKRTIDIHLCKNGFVPGYEVWTFHGESGTRVIAEDEHDCDVGDVDRMDEMLEAIQAEITEDHPTAEVEAFFKLLKPSEEPLYEHIEVILLAFITRLVSISDILPKSHKVPKDMYQCKKMMSVFDLKYEKIDVSPDNCMLFWKEHANKKFLECGQSRFIEVVTEDNEKVMIEVIEKQLR